MIMRQILFRAKRIDNGEWVYWNLWGELIRESGKRTRITVKNGATTSYYDYVHQIRNLIDESTISQYIGLCDKNGRKIFENDIVRTQEYSDKPYAKNRKTKRHIGVVEYDIGKGNGFYNEETETHDKYREYSAEWSVNVKDYGIYRHGDWGDFFDCEVIGNVFDNSELLEDN